MECSAENASIWLFIGRILPERNPVSVIVPQSTARADDFGLKFRCQVGISRGQMLVNVTITEGKIDIFTLKDLIESQVRSTIDLIGYLRGEIFDVDLVSVHSPQSGFCHVFESAIPVLLERRKDFPSAIDTNLLSAIGENTVAQIVLANFREAMRIPTDTGFFCYRAIEAMMQSMKGSDEESESAAWQTLREALLVDRAVIDEIKKHADAPRHGRPASILDEDRAKVFTYTDLVVDRYLKYLVRGKAGLSESDFAVLRIEADGKQEAPT